MTRMIDSPLLLCGVLFMTVAAAYTAAATWKWAASVGASLLIIAATALASNLGFIPDQSPVYSAFSGPRDLAGHRLAVVRRPTERPAIAGGRMIGAFALALVATAVGAILASLLFSSAFPEDGWKLGGVLTGTYSGGSLNFVGVGRALELPEDLFAAASAADNVVTSLWMGATLMLPLWLKLAGIRTPRQSPRSRMRPPHSGIEDGVPADRSISPCSEPSASSWSPESRCCRRCYPGRASCGSPPLHCSPPSWRQSRVCAAA